MVTLHLMVGVPGSGKTTYVKNHALKNDIVVSSDSIRFELYGDESIQGNPEDIFAIVRDAVKYGLNNGNNVWVDATNMTRKNRASIISCAPKFARIVADVVWQPIERCIRNDRRRDRSVGESVIRKMLHRFEFPYYDEGIDEIKIHRYHWGIVSSFLYELKCRKNMKIPHENSHHSLNVYDHCKYASEIASKSRLCNMKRVMMYHDVGKPYCKTFLNSKGEITQEAHYYGHESVGAWISIGLIRFKMIELWLISSHMEPFRQSKYYKNLPLFLRYEIIDVHDYDTRAH